MSDRFTEADVRKWQYIVSLMQANAVQGHDVHLVAEQVAKISSGAGLVNASIPMNIVTVITDAMEVGYASAVNDVRDQRLDGLGPNGPQ